MFYNPESMNIPNLFRRLMVAATILFATLSLSAQNTEYFIESTTASVDGEIAVNVRGVNIDTLVGVQFSVQWDSTVLNFLRVENVVLEGSLMGNFNQTQLVNGRIGYLEADGTLVGFGLPDSSLLFTMVFESLTTVSVNTDLSFTEKPLRTSVRSSNNNEVVPVLTSGTVNLNGTNSVRTFAEDPRLTVSPNPFQDLSQINLNLSYSGTAALEILDISGRMVVRRTQAFTAGNTSIELNAEDFPTNGTYILRITTNREQLHRKVVLQGR